MISKEELVLLKQKRKISLYYLEKEYLQHIFLNAISKYGDSIVFKGGTCLRLCYGLERASEDLDFSSSLSVSKLKEVINKCLKSFESLGIEHFDLIEKESEGSIRFEIKFKGVLFNGNLNSANNLKIDFNKNKVFFKTAIVVNQVFSDIPLFVIVALAEKEILAEKIRAIANRKQARDLYDLWILLGKKVEIDKKLIDKKLKEENVNIKNITFISREAYETDLKNLVDYIPDYEQIKKEIVKFLEGLK
ncbi:nucleotidyl transferase AbiEii/AbiGii toxin family protein [Candidatus Pacearchaeota archaeon]|nr:nucleotidyl transferase AbiEii/AbiGii toxin family protein [Candidatus Pacearchaeota archaeon]